MTKYTRKEYFDNFLNVMESKEYEWIYNKVDTLVIHRLNMLNPQCPFDERYLKSNDPRQDIADEEWSEISIKLRNWSKENKEYDTIEELIEDCKEKIDLY